MLQLVGYQFYRGRHEGFISDQGGASTFFNVPAQVRNGFAHDRGETGRGELMMNQCGVATKLCMNEDPIYEGPGQRVAVSRRGHFRPSGCRPAFAPILYRRVHRSECRGMQKGLRRSRRPPAVI